MIFTEWAYVSVHSYKSGLSLERKSLQMPTEIIMSNNVSLSFVGLEKVEQSESIICQSRRQREIDIDLQDTDKLGSVLR